jgi:hypothetical protein
MRLTLLLPLALGVSAAAWSPSSVPARLAHIHAAAALGASASAGDPDETNRAARLAEVRQLLAAGQPSDALAKARIALEYEPAEPEVLIATADAHLALGAKDPALYMLLLAEEQLAQLPEDKKLAAELDKRLVEMDPLRTSVTEAFGSLAEDTFRMAQSAHKRGLWANAVDLYLRCRGTAFEQRANKQLTVIFDSPKPAEALVASGLPIPVADKGRKSAKAIAKYDKDHALWEAAAKSKEFHSKQYRVITNMGWRMGTSISLTMEQLNKFLRRFFRHKEQGQPMRDCGLSVFATFDEFASVEGIDSPSIGGFFSPGENRISTYDQTTAGRSFDVLWETLFHEGTHQFSEDVTKTLLPGWVEEGAACYMEGAKLMPNGVMVSNLVAESRLEALVSMLGPRPKAGATTTKPKIEDARVDIREVITYYQPGSYSGMYYPWGWGLVYFMRNFEDETGDRPYLPAFEAYVEAYKSERKHDLMERFTEFFITGVKRPGILTFEDWYAQWVNWIWELDELYFGPPEMAERLLARAEKQVQNDKHEFAVETFGWALRKRPGDPRALIGLGRAKAALKDDDGAAYFFRQALAWADAQADQAAAVPGLNMDVAKLRAEAYEGIRTIHANMVEGSERTRTTFRETMVKTVADYRAAELPMVAAYRLTQAREVAGKMSELLGLEAGLAGEGIDLSLPQRLIFPGDMSGWVQQGPRVFKGEGDKAQAKSGDGLSYLIWDEEVPGDFEFSASLTFSKAPDFYAFGLVFADNLAGRKMFGVLPGGRLVSIKVKDGDNEIDEELGLVDFTAGEPFELGVRSRGGKLYYLAGGEVIAEAAVPEGALIGRVGVFNQRLAATYSNLRLRY